uniref:Uncharacterized protein n=1 Tax=Aegilops tauschii subsp. strangulata TaxID=200361 RepID=A0A453KMC7_AEGTS
SRLADSSCSTIVTINGKWRIVLRMRATLLIVFCYCMPILLVLIASHFALGRNR